MARKKAALPEPELLLAKVATGKRDLRNKQVIFSQGEPATALYCVQKGAVKLTAVSNQGKEAVTAILEAGSFFGEICLAEGPQVCLMTASALGAARILSIDRQTASRLMAQNPQFSRLFMLHLVARIRRIQEDLVDQLFNPAEKRLARALLLLAHSGKKGGEKQTALKVSHETLARMIGADRSRVSLFMNKFKKLGYIEYSRGLRVRSSLMQVILRNPPRGRAAPHKEKIS